MQFDLKPTEPRDIAERLMNESMDNQAVLDRYLLKEIFLDRYF